ncbi:ATP-binding protein [Actinomadura sp. 9N215]|uniref:ATP-binding protein n=1 Tax=Actinomadura sp. 9N215 TaxID=3375150 RepID=UPI003798A896
MGDVEGEPRNVEGELRDAGVTRREAEVFWLVADRLGNREIADRLRLSERTVESHVSALLRKLGADTRKALIDQAGRLRRRDRALPLPLPLPLSSFVGRERELADLAGLVTTHRLVTLTGPAGIGKTRVALHLAHATTALPQAVLVDLASVPPGQPVERSFADALGVEGGGRAIGPLIRSAIRARPWWLVVDNCEHVTAATAALVAGLLTAAEGLRVLATGHGPLGVAGEFVYEIPPLPSGAEDDDPAAVLDAPAVRLFLDRATAAAPGFTGDPADVARIAKICKGLDGLPLAIELAAARVRAFSPAELLDRLDDRFALLTGGARPGRHRALEEALRWSYDLLDDDERLLLERCSVFPQEFDYDTASKVLAWPPLTEDDLARVFPRLLDRSLVSSRRRGDTTRYRLLDSVRQFALRRLTERGLGEHEVARDRHARHHLEHAVALVPDLRGRDQRAALRWFDHRWTDLRTAMRRALDTGDTAAAWRFLAGIGTGWEVLGARGELFDWLEALLVRPLPEGGEGVRAAVTCCVLFCYRDTGRAREFAELAADRATDGEDRALAALALGWTAVHGRDRDATVRQLDRAAALFEELGDDWHRALVLSLHGLVAPDVRTAVHRLAAAADLFGRLGDHVKRANCLNHMAFTVIEDGTRLDEAGAWLDEATELALRAGSEHERLHAALHRTSLARRLADHAAAEAGFADLLPEFLRIGDLRCATRCRFGLGLTAAAAGDHERARTLLLAAATTGIATQDHRLIATGLRLLAEAEHALGRPVRAAELLAAVPEPLTDDGPPASDDGPPAADDGPLTADDGSPAGDGLVAALRAELGEAAFASASATGRRTPPAELLEAVSEGREPGE